MLIPQVSDIANKLNVAQVKTLILDGIINPIYTDNGQRPDRATSIPVYKIEKQSITGQFIATQNKKDVLFDFDANKSGDKWELGYGYALEQPQPTDILSIKRRLDALVTDVSCDRPDLMANNYEMSLLIKLDGYDPNSRYGVLRQVLVADNLYDRQGVSRKSSQDVMRLFDEIENGAIATLKDRAGKVISGKIIDASYVIEQKLHQSAARSKNNDFVARTEGCIALYISVACNIDDLSGSSFDFVEIGNQK